jgi:hypothetical protein
VKQSAEPIATVDVSCGGRRCLDRRLTRGGRNQAQRRMRAVTTKDPDEWKTGDEPMTAAQRSHLATLAQDAGQSFDEELTKAEVSKRIDELRQGSPRLVGD